MAWHCDRAKTSGIYGLALLVPAIAALTFGCATSPTAPDSLQPAPSFTQAINGQNEGRHLWGYWLMHVSEDHSSIEVEPVRSVAMHMNALDLLQKYNPNSVALTGVYVADDDTITAAITLTHPLSDYPQYTAFDVRGIAMFPAVNKYPTLKLTTPGFFIGEPALLNPDGYTRRWNPAEYSNGIKHFRYFDGAMITAGMGALCTSLVNPYKAFSTNPNRNQFNVGASQTLHYRLSFPEGSMVFAYAVDASWDKPNPDDNSVSVPSGFPPSANSLEPYKLSFTGFEGNLECSIGLYAGGSTNLHILVKDWQAGAFTEFANVSLECPALFQGVVHPWTGASSGDGYAYQIQVSNVLAKEPGIYPALLAHKVSKKDPDYIVGDVLVSYQVLLLEVKEISPPFCNGKTSIHADYAGAWEISNTQPNLHLDSCFLPIISGGAGGFLFDGGKVGGNEQIMTAAIDGNGGATSASTLVQRIGSEAGNALVLQANEFNGHVLIVTSADPDNLLIFDAAGKYLKEYDLGTGESGHNEPVCLTTNPVNGDIWMVGHKGNQGIHLERWAYIQQDSAYEYIYDPAMAVNLAPYLGSNPKPVGIGVNGLYNYVFLFHAANYGSLEHFDISAPPVHRDDFSVTNLFPSTLQLTSVAGLRKLIGGDMVIDHVGSEEPAQCRILLYANLSGGARLIRMDSWGKVLNSRPLGTTYSCMAINNLASESNRSLVFFPMTTGKAYALFMAPTGW